MTISLTPQDIELPPKFSRWKGRQEEAIEKIVNSQKELFLLDAPTGSGKSVVGVASSYIWRTNWNTTKRLQGADEGDCLPKRVIYVTRTKQLQDQLLADFPGSRTIKGRVNFECLLAPQKFPDFTAEDCPHRGEHNPCPHKESCPYLVAKYEALHADIAVLNESYYMAEANGPGQFSNADFVVLDEVDSIESTLMGHISLSVSLSILDDLGLALPANWEDWRDWLGWWNDTQARRAASIDQLNSQLGLDNFRPTDSEIRKNKHARKLTNFHENINAFMIEILTQLIASGAAYLPGQKIEISEAVRSARTSTQIPFVVQERKDKRGVHTGFDLKPVSIRGFAKKHLWRHSQRFLGMSGTILSPVVLARELGLGQENYDYLQLPSPFEEKNRLLFYWPVANMRKQSIDAGESIPKMVNAVDQILAKFANEKVLIHTASYQLVTAIQQNSVNNDRIMVHDSQNRTDQLEEFKRSRRPMVMVSPSFDRGVDLPDDLCRCIIVCKVPYLNLGDKQVAARLKAPGGDQWYVFKAIQTLMQMTGRGVRNEKDYCATYILDAQFTGLLARVKQYIPQWWLSSIRRIEEL